MEKSEIMLQDGEQQQQITWKGEEDRLMIKF